MRSRDSMPSAVDLPARNLPQAAPPARCSLADARWWERQRPLLLYAPFVLGLGVAALARDPRPIYVAPLLATAGVLSWGLFEYGIHRFVLHRTRALFGRQLSLAMFHAEHHRNPRVLVQLHHPLKKSLPVAAIYAFLAW